MKKKILFVTQTLYDTPLNNISISKIKKLKTEYDVLIFAQNSENIFKKFSVYADFFLVKRFNNFVLRNTFFYFSAFLFLPFLINKKNVKNVIFQTCYDLPIILFLKLIYKNKINIITEFHGDMVKGLKYYSSNMIKSFISKLFMELSIRFSDKLRIVSKKQLKDIQTEHIFPAYMDLDYFIKPLGIKRENRMLFVGYLNKIKNVDFLIKKFSKFVEKNPDFNLTIVGEGKERKKLIDLTIKLGIQEKVLFLDNMNRESLKYEYSRSKLLILPSHYEGFGRVACEAIACGINVLVSEKCGVTDILKEENIFKNSKDFDKKLEMILNSEVNKKILFLYLNDKHFMEGMKRMVM